MITRSDIALSGLRHAQSSLGASAHNTANTQTDGFSAQRVRGVEMPRNGVRTVVETQVPTAQARHISETLPGAQNNVNQVEETVNRIAALRSFEANANVVRTQDQLSQSLLDLTA